MPKWETTTIGDVLTLQRGFDITKAEQRQGSVPVISSGGISSYHDTAAAVGPGVVIGRKGTLGTAFYLADDYWPHDTTLWVKDFKGNLPRFVYYFFMNLDVKGLDVGSANPTLNRNHVHPITIRWPENAIQERIASLLGALDEKIAVNEQIIETTGRLGQAIFSQKFGRAIAHLTSGAELPADWHVATLGQSVISLETGRRPRGGVSGYLTGVPSIGAESITKLAMFDFSKVKHVPDEYFATMRQGVVQDRDILLYKDGGRPGIFQPHVSMFGNSFPFSKMCINEHVFRIRMRLPISQAFGYFWLISNPIMQEMRRRATGVAIPGLNSSAVRELPIVIPPVQHIELFESAISPLIDAAFNAAGEARTLAQLRDMLLPKLMSGKVRIKEAEQTVEEAT